MKKLLLLVGLVFFLTPMVVSAGESDLKSYHCIKSKTKNTNFDAYCFCMYPNGKIFPQRYDNMNLLVSTKNTSSCGYDYLSDDENKEISLGIYLRHGGKYKKFNNYLPIEEELTTITNKEIRKWLKEHKKLAKERKEGKGKIKTTTKATQKKLSEKKSIEEELVTDITKVTEKKIYERIYCYNKSEDRAIFNFQKECPNDYLQIDKSKYDLKKQLITKIKKTKRTRVSLKKLPPDYYNRKDKDNNTSNQQNNRSSNQAKRSSSDDDWLTFKRKNKLIYSLTPTYYNRLGQRIR